MYCAIVNANMEDGKVHPVLEQSFLVFFSIIAAYSMIQLFLG